MPVLRLDPDLKPVAPYRIPTRQHILDQTLGENGPKTAWGDTERIITEKIFDSNVPQSAALYHSNCLHYLALTYGAHQKIVFSPQQFWYTILCEMAQHVVANAAQHRQLFTRDSEGKIDIIVMCNSEAEPLRMDDIYAEMLGHVPVDTGLFLPNFTTSTEMSRLASLAAFLESCSPYYNYMMMLCGHPEVKLLGTPEDWDLISNRLAALSLEFRRCGSKLDQWISKTAGPTAEKIRSAFDGQNGDWFRTIYTEKRCGSGGQVDVDGWFARLFIQQPKHLREIGNFATHITRVPYTTLPSKTKWKLCFGMFHSDLDADGFLVPEFSWVQNQVIQHD